MAFRSNILVAAFAAVSLGACATAPASASGLIGEGAFHEGAIADGVLDQLPAHPPAGTCYARVKVVGDAPPPGGHAVWRQNPGLPGSLGPTWCLVLENGQIAPPPPERFGWVKVLCDTDATPDRVRHLQSKLRAHGDYEVAETGRYDQGTADAVARFQREQKIDHGGYLSLQTVEAIERAEVRESAVVGPPIHVSGCCQAPPPPVQIPVPVRVEVPVPYPVRVEVPVPQPYPVRVEVPVPQPYPVRVPVPQPYPVYIPAPQPCCAAPPPPQPCCAPRPQPQPQPCCRGGYGPPSGYGPSLGRDAGGWLTWAGKSTF